MQSTDAKGIALSNLKKFRDAIKDFNKIITDNPKIIMRIIRKESPF